MAHEIWVTRPLVIDGAEHWVQEMAVPVQVPAVLEHVRVTAAAYQPALQR